MMTSLIKAEFLVLHAQRKNQDVSATCVVSSKEILKLKAVILSFALIQFFGGLKMY